MREWPSHNRLQMSNQLLPSVTVCCADTEIDWEAYMQEVGGYMEVRRLSRLGGAPNGPLL